MHPNEKGELSWPFSAAIRLGRLSCPSSLPSPGPDGESRTVSPRPRMRPAWTTTRSASTAPGTATSPCLCSPTRSWPSPPAPPGPPLGRRNLSLPAGTLPASRVKRGPDACGQIFAPPRTYAPPALITDDSGRDQIPLTAGEARRLFNLHTRVTHPDEHHVRWSGWRRYRQAAARRSHYARRAEVPGHV